MNLTTFLAGTFSLAPVRGLRTTLALLFSTLKVPIEGSWSLWPFFMASPKELTKAFRATLASLSDSPAFFAMLLTNSFLVIVKTILGLDDIANCLQIYSILIQKQVFCIIFMRRRSFFWAMSVFGAKKTLFSGVCRLYTVITSPFAGSRSIIDRTKKR